MSPQPTSFILETLAGELVPVRVADGVETQVGTYQRQLARAPGSSKVVMLEGDGGLEPQPLAFEFLAKSQFPLDSLGAQTEEYALRTALRSVKGIWGAGPLEGHYLPLLGAAPTGRTLEGYAGQRRLPFDLYPADTRNRGVNDGWLYPATDTITRATLEPDSTLDVPSYKFSTGAVATVPLTFKRITSGTFFVGMLFDEPTVNAPVRLGSSFLPDPNNGGLGFSNSLVDYSAHAFGARIRAPFNRVGGAGILALFAATFSEYGQLSFYSLDVGGFSYHGSSPLGALPNLTTQRVFFGGSSFKGFIMPGAPRFKTPLLTHRVWNAADIERHLGAWHRHLTSFTQYLPVPTTPALSIDQPSTVQLVIGQPKEVLITVRRLNGLAAPITLTAAPDSISLRVSPLVEIVDTDFTNDIFKLTLTPESGLSLGDHTVTFTATTAAGLRSAVTLNTRVLGELPGLPTGTTHFHAIFAPTNKLLSNMVKNQGSRGTAGNLVLGGLVRPSNGWDALIGDGSNIPGYGPSVATVDAYVSDMAQPHTVSWSFWDVDKLPVNSVLFALASQTNKNDFWQVYKDAAGLKVRVSKGTTSQVTAVSVQTLTTPQGVLHLSVQVSQTSITLTNPTLDLFASVTNPGLSGVGRLTLFGTKLSDGSVQGLSQGVALAGSVQNALVT